MSQREKDNCTYDLLTIGAACPVILGGVVRVRIITVIDIRTHNAYLMTDDAATTGRHAGHYRTVCGELAPAAPSPPRARPLPGVRAMASDTMNTG